MKNTGKTGKKPSIAIVHDRLNVRGGGEMFLEELCRLYPDAPIYTLIYEPSAFTDSPISEHKIHTSFIDKLPLSKKNHRLYIALMPLAIQLFNLSGYDIIISSSAAFAHGVRTNIDQLHISYIHSPMRYAWHQYRQHTELGYGSLPIRALLWALRAWDRRVARRPKHLLANSNWTAELIRRAFNRDATVIYPPVHTEKFSAASSRADYYLTVSRLVPYKRVDLIVKAFNQLGSRLIIAGDGPELGALKQGAKSNIEFRSGQSDEQIASLMGSAKAFMFAAEEDFGIAAVEAQAAGCPVIAYRSGGLLETVIEGKTGIFFNTQSAEAIVEAVRKFESGVQFIQSEIQANAQRFSAERFGKSFTRFVNEKWREFQARE